VAEPEEVHPTAERRRVPAHEFSVHLAVHARVRRMSRRSRVG
jgi:hypothetical protein